mmetsp:Transcript_23824/g.43009  ORF Transcript_23824/g.43009 Transcript_23824/m.43009 type:complete len:494 (-) Transcript_23824:998-2479(-)
MSRPVRYLTVPLSTEVVVIRQLIVRLVQVQVVHHILGIGLLRFHHLGKEGVVFGDARSDLVPGFKLGGHHAVGCAVHVHAIRFLQFQQVIGIPLGVAPVKARVFGHGRVLDDRLMLSRQGVELVFVDRDLKEFLALVVGCQVVMLGHVLHPKVAVGGGVVELGCVDQAGFHRGLNFATGQLHNRHTHFQQNVSRQTNSPVLEAVHLGGICDLLLEPAQRLRRHGRVEEGHDVQAQVFHQLVKQFLTSTGVDPAQHFLARPAKAGAGAKQRRRFGFTVPVGRHIVRRVQNAAVDRVLHLAGFHNGVDRKHFDGQRPARHLVDAGCKGLRVFQKDTAAPGRLHLERRAMAVRNCGRGQCGGANNGGTAQKLSAVKCVCHVSSQGILFERSRERPVVFVGSMLRELCTIARHRTRCRAIFCTFPNQILGCERLMARAPFTMPVKRVGRDGRVPVPICRMCGASPLCDFEGMLLNLFANYEHLSGALSPFHKVYNRC